MNIPYQLFEHTSDLGVEVRGDTLKDLFRNATLAVLDLGMEEAEAKPESIKIIEISESNPELLLKEWLSEIVYQVMLMGFICSDIRIIQIDRHQLQAELLGEQHNSRRHQIRRELKGITYHQLSIIRQERGWTARFVIDV